MKDKNKRKLKVVFDGLKEIIWDTIPLAVMCVSGFLMGLAAVKLVGC